MTPSASSTERTVAESGSVTVSSSGARDRREDRRVLERKRHTIRILLALAVSMVLLLVALGLRRDQIRREAARAELRVLSDALERWVHEHRTLPRELQAISNKIQGKMDLDRWEYASRERRSLATQGSMPVALVTDRLDHHQLFGEDGRPVLLCRRRAPFQVKWLSNRELERQRRREEKRLEEDRSLIQAAP